MNSVLLITRRNLRLFFRDRSAVFFSMLSAIILIGLYGLFLGDQQVSGLKESFPHASTKDVNAFVISWVFAGVAMITTLTTGLSALSQLVEDGESGRFQDFLVSPVRRVQLVSGYLLSSFSISLMISVATVVVGQLYLVVRGDHVMTAAQALTCLGYLALSSAAFVSFAGFAVTFIGSSRAFSALATIVGTLVGFLAGAYIPPGVLPNGVVNFVQSLPFAQSAMLIRQPLTHIAENRVTGGGAQATSTLSSFYGMTGKIGSVTVTNGFALTELAAVAVVFAILAAWRIGARIR